MSERLLRLAERIRTELADLERLVEHMQAVFMQMRSEFLAFAEFLENQGQEGEGN